LTVPPTNQGRKFAPEPLTREELTRLMAAVSVRSKSGIRLRAMIAVMSGAGLRLAETLNLEPRDVDLQNCTVRVRQGKGNKSRVVGISEGAAAHLARWMDIRARLGLTARHPIFATYAGEGVGHTLQQRYVRAALVRAADKADIVKRVHPHGLRHTLAFLMAQQGMPTHMIQAQLGHGSLAVTDRYIKHLLPADLVGAVRQMEWIEG
jgi:integrase